ncbi:helix-turn-helix domain-containing protein [Mycobacterium sp. IS-1496]|uniref:TetR/AcrR family transcriptional regulator n=1 Tax=Mycobacterium sp. IS-1496 TaxID=1772284 RepID=UPI0012FBCE14
MASTASRPRPSHHPFELPARSSHSPDQRPERLENGCEPIVSSPLALAVDGYDAVHIRMVADDAGVTASSVFQYFASKDDLLVAALDQWRTSLNSASTAERDAVTDPSSRSSHLKKC